jgi:hypothetical protein
MAAVNSVAQNLSANYKQTYGPKLETLVPDGVKAYKDIKLMLGEQQQGGIYNQPLAMALEQGISYGAGDQVIALNAAVAGKLENATITGAQMVGRSQFGWTVASRASRGPNYFVQGTEVVLRSLMLVTKKRAEAEIFYGGSGLTKVSGSPTLSGSNYICTLDPASFAAGMWVGMEGCPIDVYTDTPANSGTFVCTTKIVAVDINNTKITVDSNGAAISNGNLFFYKGAFGVESNGIQYILNLTTGNQFGIPIASYPDMLQGTQYSVAGTLSFAKVVKGLAQALPRGGEGRFKIYTHPESWQDLVNEGEAARTFGGDQWKPSGIERGTESIKFYSVAGMVEIVPSVYVKRGDAFALLQDGSWKRIGSTDITMRVPGMENDQVFVPIQDAAGFEVRCYKDFALFCDRPAASVYYSGIVPST